MKKQEVCWAIFNGGGHLLPWTIRRTKSWTLKDHLCYMQTSRDIMRSWKSIKKIYRHTVRRVTVEWEG